MADPITSVSGLASGVQWRDLVDQVMLAEKARSLDPINSRIALQDKQRTAWQSFQNLAAKLGDAAKALQTGAAFGAVKSAVGSSPTTNRALLAVAAAANTAPGSYKVEVLDLARAEKLSGGVVASATDPLGVGGSFVINGRAVSLDAADSLNAVRDKINAANSGTNPSGVTATVLSTGTSAHRLVLTSTSAGAAGIDLVDGPEGALRSLGVVDGTRVANATEDGGTRTQRFSSTTQAIATMLGVTFPPPSSIVVGGKSIAVDLSVDSLSSIASKIQAAGGTAQTTTETVGGVSQSRLLVGGTTSAATPDGQRALELLGFVQSGRGAVAQAVRTENTLTVGATAAAAGAGTLLTDLGTNGTAGGVAAGDSFTVRGKRADGTAVSVSYTVQSGDTVQSLLDRLNSTSDGFGAGSRPAVATLENGRIRLTDAAGGDSQLSLSITANNEGGGSLTFGRTSTVDVGRQREVVAGSDARLRVDGVLLTRGSNSVSDALAGVTLDLQQAEPGTTVDLTVTRDDTAAVDGVKAFASAYNDVVKFLDQQRTTGQPLYANTVLRSAVSTLTAALRTTVPAAGGYTRAALAGVALSRDGTIQVDETALRGGLSSSLADIKALFGGGGVGKAMTDAAGVVTRAVTGTAATQVTSLDNSTAAARKRAEAVQQRLDDRRQQMIVQFTQMEQALSRLQSQGSALTSQLNALQRS